MDQKANRFEVWTDVYTESKSQPETVTVYAGHAQSEDDLIRYDGNVRLFRGATSQIQADSISPDKNNGFTAFGHVNSQIEGMKASAEKLVYNGERNTADYSGNVHAIKEDKKGKMDLQSANMTLIIDPGDPKTQRKAQLKELKADTKVRLTQGARRGTGDHLVYNYATDVVNLTADKGSRVTIDDPSTLSSDNISWARWTSAGGKIETGNDEGGKVLSQLPVKKK